MGDGIGDTKLKELFAINIFINKPLTFEKMSISSVLKANSIFSHAKVLKFFAAANSTFTCSFILKYHVNIFSDGHSQSFLPLLLIHHG